MTEDYVLKYSKFDTNTPHYIKELSGENDKD